MFYGFLVGMLYQQETLTHNGNDITSFELKTAFLYLLQNFHK